MNYFHLEKPTGKFVALYADGSGADIYWRMDDLPCGLPLYVDATGEEVQEPETYFEDAGYLAWLPLPDDFKTWFEQSPT